MHRVRSLAIECVLSVSRYVNIDACTRMCARVFTCIHTNMPQEQVCVCLYTYTCVCVIFMHTNVCVRVFVYTYTYMPQVPVCVCLYTIYIYTCMHNIDVCMACTLYACVCYTHVCICTYVYVYVYVYIICK